MHTRLILSIFPLVKPFKINQNANRLPAKQILISVAHTKEHFCRIKMSPNLSKFFQYFPEKSSEKIIIGIKQRAPPAATAKTPPLMLCVHRQGFKFKQGSKSRLNF